MTGRSMVDGGREYLDAAVITADTDRHAAALRAATWVADRHPHPLDDQSPRLAGKLTGRNPQARRDLLNVLAALGLHNPPQEGDHA